MNTPSIDINVMSLISTTHGMLPPLEGDDQPSTQLEVVESNLLDLGNHLMCDSGRAGARGGKAINKPLAQVVDITDSIESHPRPR
jgi:hypothetical protein